MRKDLNQYNFYDVKELFTTEEKINIFYDEEIFKAQREINKKIESLRPALEQYILKFTSNKYYYCETSEIVHKEDFLKYCLKVTINKDNFTRNVKSHKYSVEQLTEFFNIIEKETYQLNTNN